MDRIDARNDIWHIIRLWYLKEDYNRDLPDNKQAKNICWLHGQMTKDRRVQERVFA